MKTPRKLLLASLALAVVFADRPAFAQTNFLCAWKTIQEKVEATNEGKFNQQKVVEELGEVDFLKQQKFETGGPCQKVYISLAEFIDEAGAALTELGMVGYVRMSACLIRVSDDYVHHLRTAFVKSGQFKGVDFDKVMMQLADDTKFTFNAKNRTFTSSRSGLIYEKMDFNEGHRINHILKGHIDNDWSVGQGKSLFANADDVFDVIDEGWLSPSKAHPLKPDGTPDLRVWEVELPSVIGTANETHLRIVVKEPGSSIITTAFPFIP